MNIWSDELHGSYSIQLACSTLLHAPNLWGCLCEFLGLERMTGIVEKGNAFVLSHSWLQFFESRSGGSVSVCFALSQAPGLA